MKLALLWLLRLSSHAHIQPPKPMNEHIFIILFTSSLQHMHTVHLQMDVFDTLGLIWDKTFREDPLTHCYTTPSLLLVETSLPHLALLTLIDLLFPSLLCAPHPPSPVPPPSPSTPSPCLTAYPGRTLGESAAGGLQVVGLTCAWPWLKVLRPFLPPPVLSLHLSFCDVNTAQLSLGDTTDTERAAVLCESKGIWLLFDFPKTVSKNEKGRNVKKCGAKIKDFKLMSVQAAYVQYLNRVWALSLGC